MIESKPKKYEFKNSLFLYSISIALSIIIPCVLLYFIDFKRNPKLAIAVGILGLLSLLYYGRSFFDRRSKLTFDSEGIKTKNKILKWEKIKGFEIKIITRSKGTSIYNLIIYLKKDKEVWIDITNLDLTEQKVELIFTQFNAKKTAANSGYAT